MLYTVIYPNNSPVKVEAKSYWEALNKSTLAVANKIAMITKEFVVTVTCVGNEVKEVFLFTTAGEFEKS